MAIKNTVAIIASKKENVEAIVNKFSVKNYRLLLVAKHQNQYDGLIHKIQTKYPGMEVEVVNCMKDGCWEADIIVLDISPLEENEVAEMIKEVAIQKPVINFSKNLQSMIDENKSMIDTNNLQKLLKHSKVVNVFIRNDLFEISETAADPDVIMFVSDLLNKNPGFAATNQVN